MKFGTETDQCLPTYHVWNSTKAATACKATMRNIQFLTVMLNSPSTILGGERLSILLRCTATDVCTFLFLDWNIPSLCLLALYGFAVRHVTTTNRSAWNVNPFPLTVCPLFQQNISRGSMCRPLPQLLQQSSTLPHDEPEWNNSRVEFGPSLAGER